MKKNNKNRVALFVCHDLIGLLIVNGLVPQMIRDGWDPLLINTGNKRNRKVIVPPPAEPSFYGAGIADKALLPFLDQNQPVLDHIGKPIEGVNYSFKQVAELYNIAYHEIDSVDGSELKALIVEDDSIVGGISLRFLQVFSQDLIDLVEAKGFFWNLHGGILPQYKGLLIPYRAIKNGEKEYGWTLHRMAREIDAGDIISVRKQPLDPKKAIFDIYMDMIPEGNGMLQAALATYRTTGGYEKTPQEDWGGSAYYPYPTAEEMIDYRKMGIHFINSPLRHIENITSLFSLTSRNHAFNLRDALVASVREWQETLGSENISREIRQDRAA